MDECLGGILIKVPPDTAKRVKLEKGLPAEEANALEKRQVSVKSDIEGKNHIRRW